MYNHYTPCMRYDLIDSSLFIKNRKKLTERILPSSLIILHSNDLYPTNADGVSRFFQHSDLFYLSGIDQEETILLLFPDAVLPENREILFIKETNEHIAIWEGEKLSKSQASERSGITNVQWTSNFESTIQNLMGAAQHVYLSNNEHPRALNEIETRNDRHSKDLRDKYPLHQYQRLSPHLHSLRAIKEQCEVDLIKKACEITRDGFLKLLKIIKPGVGEWELEATLIKSFIEKKSKGFAYTPIIGSGKNANTLHYIENNSICHSGDLILMDVAAEYANYNADMTRVVPVNGIFTPRQKEVYNSVLHIHRTANTLLRPGITLKDYQKHILEATEEQLIKLNLISLKDAKQQDASKPLVKKFFMHGTSHHLGLDVHDVSPPNGVVETGNVFTIEPGIYIAEEEIGIRLENDFYIGEKENLDLMHDIPIEAEEIEDLMQC